MDMPTSSSVVAFNDLEFRSIAKAIRTYLRNDYAFELLGLGDAPPLRISAYSGKGVGHYATAADGRADWTQAFYRYMERSLGRAAMSAEMRFGFAEVQAAMEQLRIENKQWYDVVYNVEVLGGRVEDYALDLKVDVSTIKRRRKRATFFLYSRLRLVPARSTRAIEYRLVNVA